MTSYPHSANNDSGACIASVEPNSPAAEAGLKSGMVVLAVDGQPLNDILDWYWLADEYEVELEVTQSALTRQIYLTREPGESWGIEFSEVIFDGLRSCVNNCSFCFMKMLPEDMRSALYVRDDDYRLSFLHGNFVTLTNLTQDEVQRIIDLHLSPLNVSLHATRTDVRTQLMGKNHQRGLEVLERLLAAGIECKVQIVLLPGVNDGVVLEETLTWIAARPGISAAGIVPYGYTKYATLTHGFSSPQSAREVIKQVEQFKKAHALNVCLADEFYIKAWPQEIISHVPSASYYQEFSMIEDGIGLVRQFIDSFDARAFEAHLVEGTTIVATGKAFAAVLHELLPGHTDVIIGIKNEFFGGNVDVAGLLTATDICSQVPAHLQQLAQKRREAVPMLAHNEQTSTVILPAAMFNDDGLTLDNKCLTDIAAALKTTVKVID